MPELRYHWIEAANQRTRRTGAKVKCIILHSTDGRRAGDIATLTQAGGRMVSVHWYVCKNGDIYHFVDNSRCAYHAGVVDAAAHDNDHSLGVEQEHIDGQEDWPAALINATALVVAFLRQKYGPLPALSHASVARPVGRKRDPVAYPWHELQAAVEALARQVITAVRI